MKFRIDKASGEAVGNDIASFPVEGGILELYSLEELMKVVDVEEGILLCAGGKTSLPRITIADYYLDGF